MKRHFPYFLAVGILMTLASVAGDIVKDKEIIKGISESIETFWFIIIIFFCLVLASILQARYSSKQEVNELPENKLNFSDWWKTTAVVWIEERTKDGIFILKYAAQLVGRLFLYIFEMIFGLIIMGLMHKLALTVKYYLIIGYQEFSNFCSHILSIIL
jgi:hypothetical protein